MFKELIKCTILTVCNNFENLLYFDEIYVFNDGFIVEKGDPKEMIRKRSSYLHIVLRKLDSTLYKLINQCIDEGKSDAQIMEELFIIPSWLKSKNTEQLPKTDPNQHNSDGGEFEYE